MGLQVLMSSRMTSIMALFWSSPLAISASTRCLKSVKASATAALSTIIALAQLASLPTARNSKRLPVKAKGDVRLRSVLSMSSSGIPGMSSFMPFLPATVNRSFLSASSIWSSKSVSCLPKNDEMIAGGASFAPSLWSLVALITLALSSPLWR